MKKKLKYSLSGLFIVFVALPALAIVFWQYLPYQEQAAWQIKGQLAARGLLAEELKVVSLNSSHAELAGIRLQGGLSARKVSADYSLDGLSRIEAEGVALTVTRAGDTWRIGGLEKMEKGAGGALPEVAVNDVTVTVKGVQKDDVVLHIPHAEAKGGVLVLKSVETMWGGGKVETGLVSIPLALDKPVRVALTFSAVDLSQLLQEMAEGKVSGTGRVSGTLPVTWHPGGNIDLAGGVAQALEAGKLAISKEALPLDEQSAMAQVRAALGNFQYKSLSMKFDSEGDKTVIRLSVEGSSPDAFEGRPVKLNVNLTGDIIPVLRQTIMPMSDPKQFLKKNK